MKKRKRKKTRIFYWTAGGLIFIILTLVLIATCVPISSEGITDFINRKVSQELNADFKVEKATFYLFRQVNLNKLRLLYKGAYLQVDTLRANYSLFYYLKERKIPIEAHLENVKLSYNVSANLQVLQALFQIRGLPRGNRLEFNTVEINFAYCPAGFELGNLIARGRQLNITGQGYYGPCGPVNYRIKIDLPASVANILDKFLNKAKRRKQVIIIEFEGDYNNPRSFLQTRYGRIPLR